MGKNFVGRASRLSGLVKRRALVFVALASVAVVALGGSALASRTNASRKVHRHDSGANSLASIVRAELAGKTPASVKAELNAHVPLTVGQKVPGFPKGVKPAAASIFHFTAADIAKLKKGRYTAAIAMHLSNAAWPELQIKGITRTLHRFGIKVVATTSANGVASTQVSQLSTLVSRKPTAIFSIPVNPVSEASAYKQVGKAGIKLILLDNVPSGLRPGKNYVTIVSADNGGNGYFAAKKLLGQIGCSAVGFIGLDYYFPVVNARDTQATAVLHSKCPKDTIYTSNLSNLVTTDALPLAQAMIARHPNIKGFWAAWDSIAQEIVSAEEAAGVHIPIATTDVGPSSALEMAQGYITAIGAQQPYKQGVAEANALAYNLLGKKVPPFIELPTVPVTLKDLIPAYKIVNGSMPPANVIAAIKTAVGIK